MERMNRRKFLKRTGKLTLAGTAALSIGPVISHFVPNSMKLAFASETQVEFDVYNDVNPNAKAIVAHTFKDCLAQKLWPGICYKTSKPMVAVAAGNQCRPCRPDVVRPRSSCRTPRRPHRRRCRRPPGSSCRRWPPKGAPQRPCPGCP